MQFDGQFWLFMLALSCSVWPLLRGCRRSRSSRLVLIGTVAICLVGIASWRPAADPVLQESLPVRMEHDGFVGSKTCRSCHPRHYATWHDSFHRTMTQVASPQTVVAPFDGIHLSGAERSCSLERRGEEFWVRLPDPDQQAILADRGASAQQLAEIPIVERRIVLTTGSHHMQEYWLRSRFGNMLHQLPFVYRIAERRWIPREQAFLRPPDKPGGFPCWNETCLPCHSTGGQPGADPQTAQLFSRIVEFGISCEACHGPADEHVRRHRNPLQRARLHASEEADATIVNPERCSAETASQICGQCHSYSHPVDAEDYWLHGPRYRAGDDLWESRRLEQPGERNDHHPFWSDGTVRVGGREFPALIASRCYQGGELSCLSCHAMHQSDPNDQLAPKMDGDQACLQCHPSYAERIAEHTHHPASSAGSRCYNCHMPFTSYALLTAIRSHRIDSPSVSSSASNVRPNACNLCHLDRTLAWSANWLSQWYGDAGSGTVAELSDEERELAVSLLWLLRGDAAQRAIAAWHMGWEAALEASGKDWQAPMLAQLLDDPYPAVRFVAQRSLRQLPGFADFSYDFLAGDEQRRSAIDNAIQVWRQGSNDRAGAEIALDDYRTPNWSVIRGLQQKRDDRPIHIAE